MIFSELQDSIKLNASEDPSIINTLCMVRSLFKDVRNETGMPLSQCPVGDGQLHQELIRVSKELISIYEDNDESLQRNRARLDSVMEKLRTAQADLEVIAEAENLLPDKQTEYQALEAKLTAAKAAQAAYEKLLADIQSAQAELALLKRFDFDAADQKLLDLQKQIGRLQDRPADEEKLIIE